MYKSAFYKTCRYICRLNIMIRKIFLFLFICSLCSCKDKLFVTAKDNYQLNITIENIDNAIAYLKTQENGFLITIDSTIVKNNQFSFSGSIKKPVIYGIYIKGIKGNIGLFMENEIITIKAYKDSLSSSKIIGSKTNNDYLNFVNQSNQIISKMNVLFPVFQKARAENDVEKLKNIHKKMESINNENTLFILNYAKKHPDSYISAMALHSLINLPTINKDTLSNIYNHFSNYVKQGDFSIEIAAFLDTKHNNINKID